MKVDILEYVTKNFRDSHNRIISNLGNIVLTGIGGSGKSAIGKQLAKLIGLGYLDMDEFLERTFGKSINDIFEKDGEAVFREREFKLLNSLLGVRGHVISAGGGALLSKESMSLAHSIGPVVWIQSSPIEVARRLFKRVDEMEKRPLFKDLLSVEDHAKRQEMIGGRVSKMMEERRSYYSQADVVLDGSYVTPEMAAQHLKDILVTEGLIKVDQHRFASWKRKGSLPA